MVEEHDYQQNIILKLEQQLTDFEKQVFELKKTILIIKKLPKS